MRCLVKCSYNKLTNATCEIYKVITFGKETKNTYYLQVVINGNNIFSKYYSDYFKSVQRYKEFTKLLKCKDL